MGLKLCPICGEPDARPFRHDISPDEAGLIGLRKCRAEGCDKIATPTCVLGVGHAVYLCPDDHVDKGPS